MRIALIVARVLLGLAFAFAGASGFYLVFSKGPPPVEGLAGEFQHAFFESRWVLFVDAVELVAGVLLMANRLVGAALVVLAAVLFNILVFHITMQPQTILPGVILCALWAVVAWQNRGALSPLFAPGSRR